MVKIPTQSRNNRIKPSNKNKKKEKDKIPGNGSGGALDEKGNPFPIENQDGGDPTCPGGYKIDYDFDPFNDPINPLFRCISALKDPNDIITSNIMNKLNNPESGVTDIVKSEIPIKIPAAGGSRKHTPRRTRLLRRSNRQKHTPRRTRRLRRNKK
jgi:hypothetical protein